MYNLYQSQLRKDIQHNVYRNPTFTVQLFGKEYFGVIKPKKIGPFTLQRCQIMGVELPDDQKYVRSEIAKLKNKFRKKCFFFQWGIINDILTFENSRHKCDEFKEDMKAFRLGLQHTLQLDYGITPAFRENMPMAGIAYDTTKSDEVLLKDMNESCRKRIKKAIAGGMEYRIVGEDQYDEFFIKWQNTADAK